MTKKEKRFIKVYSDGGGFAGVATYILVDKQTGVNYIYASSGYSGGITPLLDREGKPIITPVPKEYDM